MPRNTLKRLKEYDSDQTHRLLIIIAFLLSIIAVTWVITVIQMLR